MLELFCNLQTKTISKSAHSIAEFVLPPFYLGETRKIRIHTFIPSYDPIDPVEIQSVETDVALQSTDTGSNAIIINSLSPVAGQLYREGVLAIPSASDLANPFITLAIRVTTGTDVVTFERQATLIQQTVDFGLPITPAGGLIPATSSITVFQSLTGASSSLETVTTVGALNVAYMVNEGGSIHVWNLVAGNAATNTTNGVLRPLDFNASTNAKIFVRAD